MANEPNLKLKSVTCRVKLRAYAGLLQTLESSPDLFGSISDVVRDCLEKEFGDVPLSEKWKDWCAQQMRSAKKARMEKRLLRKQKTHNTWARLFKEEKK